MQWLSIFIGGGLGSLARYGMYRWLGQSGSGFPLGTLGANLAACIILGFLGGLLMEKVELPDFVKGGVMIGFCGGFSTFSTFSNETLGLFSVGKPGVGLAYVLASLVVCVLGIWLGQWLGRAVA